MFPTRFTLFDLNPNNLALLLVILMFSLMPFFKTGAWRGWIVGVVQGILFLLLVGTGSRGAIFALIAGVLVFLCVRKRQGQTLGKTRVYVCVLVGMLGCAVAGQFLFPKSARLAQFNLARDTSEYRRLEIWSKAPAMMVAAPGGWGINNVGEAYSQWFQPMGQKQTYRHLLNSHLTWLVGLGWLGRWGYLVAWALAGVMFWGPLSRHWTSTWGAAVFVAFATGLWFNGAGVWWNWIVPLLWLVCVIGRRGAHKEWPSRKQWFAASVSPLMALAILYAAGSKKSSVRICGNSIWLGHGPAKLAIIEPDKKILGEFYGPGLRDLVERGDWDTIVIPNILDQGSGDFFIGCERVVFSGMTEESLQPWKSMLANHGTGTVIFLNCQVPPDDWMLKFGKIIYVKGQFAEDSYARQWKDWSLKTANIQTVEVAGDGDYIADWQFFLKKP